jgi:predicted nucleic acid-binding Zn ribbon protein
MVERREAPPLILPRKKCSNCGDVISAQAKFCDKCRAPQPEKTEKKYEAPPLIIPRVYCVNCGDVISAQAKFCDKCRAPQPV